MKRRLQYVFAAVGIAIFAFICKKIGLGAILDHLHSVGWWIVPTFLLSIVWYYIYTIAWRQFLKPLNGKIRSFELFKIKIIGEAVNTVTPVNFIGGDPARAYLLRYRYPIEASAASVVVDRTLHCIAILALILIGAVAALTGLTFLPTNIKYGLPIVLLIAAGFIGFIFVHQHKGLFSLLPKKFFSSRMLEKFKEIDGHIQDFYKNNRAGFWRALAMHFVGRVLGIFEIFFVGYAINPDFSIRVAFLLGAVAPILNFTFAFIPGAMGVIEGSFSAILYSLHFSPAIGLSIQIIRRLRAAVWILTGFIFLGTHRTRELILNPQTSSGNMDQILPHP